MSLFPAAPFGINIIGWIGFFLYFCIILLFLWTTL